MDQIAAAVAAIITAIETSEAVRWFKFSRWGYASANTAHILGIAMLVGAILPLDLRLMGLWGSVSRAGVVRILVPVAAAGLALAVMAGCLLFTVRAGHYAASWIFQAKLALIVAGTVLALTFHLRSGLWVERAGPAQARFHGAASMLCWVGALVSGRLIAYVTP